MIKNSLNFLHKYLLINRKKKIFFSIFKGYRILKKRNNVDLTHELRILLTKTKINNTKLRGFSSNNTIDIELVIRQYLTLKILGISFNKSILYSVGSNKPLRHPLPKEWRNALEERGINFDKFGCAILWYLYSFYLFLNSAILELQDIFLLLKERKYNFGCYAYFDNLINKPGVFYVSSNIKDHNIVNWYFQWKGKNKKVRNICHTMEGISDFSLGDYDITQTKVLHQLKGLKLLNYIVVVIYLFFYSFLVFIFNQYQGILFREISQVRRVKLLKEGELAREYFFNNTSPYYRPIWTYFVEEKGSKVLFYVYSISHINPSKKYNKLSQHPWNLATWTHYLLWDEYQVNFIKTHVKNNPIIEKVGVIWFSSSKKQVDIPPRSIAVFDITPPRPAMRLMYGVVFENYTADIVVQFMSDVYRVASKYNLNIAFKMKRVDKYADKRYLREIVQLSENSDFINLDPHIDATQVIQKTEACISIPFTSTGVIAAHEGKKSAYYDPIGIYDKDNVSSHGVPLLIGIRELEEWIEKIALTN